MRDTVMQKRKREKRKERRYKKVYKYKIIKNIKYISLSMGIIIQIESTLWWIEMINLNGETRVDKEHWC